MSADDYTSSVSSPASSYGLLMFGDAGGLDSWSSPASSMSFSSGNGQHPGSGLSREDYERRLQQLQTQNSLLQVEAQTSKAAYCELVQAVPALIGMTSNPYGFQVPSQPRVSSQDSPLAQEDYLKVQFWHRSAYSARTSDGLSNDTGPGGESTAMAFIEDTSGLHVGPARVGLMSKTAASIWISLIQAGVAPTRWGQASIDVLTHFHAEMRRHFPELRYCADNWKGQLLATTNYPSFIRSRRHLLGTPVKVAPDSEDGEDLSPGDSSGPKRRCGDKKQDPRKKVKTEDAAMIAKLHDPLFPAPVPVTPADFVVTEAAVLSVVSTPSPGPPPLVSTSVPGAPIVVPGPRIPALLDAYLAPMPVTDVTDVTVPDSTGVDLLSTTNATEDAAAAAAVCISPEATPEVVPVTSATMQIPGLSPGNGTSLVLPLSDPSSMPSDTAALACPGPSSTALPTPGPPSAQIKAKAGSGKMTFSKTSFTARNWCASEWIPKFKGSREEFAAYWHSIQDTAEHKRLIIDAAEAKAKGNGAKSQAAI